jgi:uncharacterized membrane protein YkvA (DUF1232 family)
MGEPEAPFMQVVDTWKQWARQLKRESYALYLACRDPRVPWVAKLFAGCVVAYAFSPIDLIPDFVPVAGYLDDLVIIPLGILAARKMIPPVVLAECRMQAQEIMEGKKPTNRLAAGVIVAIWVSPATIAVVLVVRYLR